MKSSAFPADGFDLSLLFPPSILYAESIADYLLSDYLPTWPPLRISENKIVWMPSTRTFSGYCVDTTKNIDAVGPGCYNKSTGWVNCLDLSTTEKLWKICGFHITFGISTSLEGIATSSGNFVTTSKHTYAYARDTKSTSTKRLFKLYAEVSWSRSPGRKSDASSPLDH